MSEPVSVIGSYVSPYVRKVLVVLELKGVPYRIDPIAPFYGSDEFSRLSPLRRIPVLLDGDLVLNDSSVICQYLEERHPTPSLYPADVGRRAQARWLEEYADTRLGDVLVWRLFFQRVRRHVFGEASNEAVMQDARDVQIPQALDYLEPLLPMDGYLFGALSIADISLACFFRNAAFVRYTVDAARWPRTAAFAERMLALEPFRKLARYEDACLRLPPPQQREALAAVGAPVTDWTVGTESARHGVPRE